MKRILCVLLTALMALCLCGCGSSSPESVTEDFFKGIKKGDQKILDKLYLGDAKGSIVEELLEIAEETESLGDFGEALSEGILDFDYDVESVDIDGDNAVAHVEIETENWATVMANSAVLIGAKVLSMALDGKSEKQINKAVKEIFDEQCDKTEDVEFDVDLKLVKDNGEWKLDISDCSEAIVRAISGGLSY